MRTGQLRPAATGRPIATAVLLVAVGAAVLACQPSPSPSVPVVPSTGPPSSSAPTSPSPQPPSGSGGPKPSIEVPPPAY